MGSVNVSVNINQAAMQQFMQQQVGGAFQRAAGRVRDNAKAEITRAGRVDTGQMRNATVAETVQVSGNEIRVRVVNDTPQAVYNHEGTPQRIYPRRARVLRFTPRGGSFTFAPSVRGIHPNNPTKPLPFLKRPLEALTEADFL